MHVVPGKASTLMAFACATIALFMSLGGRTGAEAGVVPVNGDVDCSGGQFPVNAVDALKVLRYTIALPVSQTEPCPDIGNDIGTGQLNGDVDCDGDVDPVDALKILRKSRGLDVIQNPGCPPIGT